MTNSLLASLSELPEYRQVLGNLIARDLKVKYQTKALGFLWSLVYPAIMLGIWYTIFSRVLRLNIPHYWAFLMAGMLPFQFIQNGIAEGAGSVRRNAGLIRKIYVPMEVLVIAGVTVKLVEFVLQLLVAILLLMLLHRGGVDAEFSLLKTIIVLPAATLLLYLFVLGVSLPLAGWTIIYRDLDHIVSLMMTALFYMTPIFWSLTIVPETNWLPLFALNPAMDLIELFRGPLYYGQWPVNYAVEGGTTYAWTIAASFSAVSLIGGYALFGRSKRVLAEIV